MEFCTKLWNDLTSRFTRCKLRHSCLRFVDQLGEKIMKEYKLTGTEAKFAEIIWNNSPIQSGDLVKLCESELNWKKSTTYTMLKRLEKKEIFVNKDSIISEMVTKEDFYAEQSKQFVNETYDGSLPKFVAAFTKREKLSKSEISELQTLIDGYKEV